MLTDKVWSGVASLLDNYIDGIRPDDTAIIAYASGSREPAAWVSIALGEHKTPVKKVWMAPLRDDGFAARFAAALPAPDELPGRHVVLTFERETMSHNNQLRGMLSSYDPARYLVVRVISAGPDLFSQAILPVPDELSARNTTLLDRCMPVNTLHIEAARRHVTGRYLGFGHLPLGQQSRHPPRRHLRHVARGRSRDLPVENRRSPGCGFRPQYERDYRCRRAAARSSGNRLYRGQQGHAFRMRRCGTVAHPRSLFLTAQWHQCGRIGIRHEFRCRERGAAELPHQRTPARRPYRVRPAQSACQRRRLSVRVACRSDHARRQHLYGRKSGAHRSRSAHALDQTTPGRFSRRGY